MKKMNLRLMGLYTIVAIFSGLFGFLIAGANNVTFVGHDRNLDHTGSLASHNNKVNHLKAHTTSIELPENALIPTIKAELKTDPLSGFNLHLLTNNFTFAPEASGLKHKDGMGHAHVYVDGQKFARLYSDWHHIDEIPKGAKQMLITLNSNDHRPLVFRDKIISAVIDLTSEPQTTAMFKSR